MFGADTSGVVIFEKPPQAFMLETLDYYSPIVTLGYVKRNFTYVK